MDPGSVDLNRCDRPCRTQPAPFSGRYGGGVFPLITSCDDVVLLVGADYFFELLHVGGRVNG